MLSRDDFLAHLDADAHLLAAAAAQGLEADVPCCAAWSVRDLVVHTAEVYAHKAAVVLAGDVDEWPSRPRLPEGVDPLQWFRDQAARLYDVLSTADPSVRVKTFGPDNTTAFWIRRMALETVVHRIDAEQAHGYESAIDPELAGDGIAELFEVFVSRSQSDGGFQLIVTEHEEWTARIGIVAGETGGSATVAFSSTEGERAVASGEPDRVFLWLWGRAPIEEVAVAGDPAVAARFRTACSRHL